MWSDLFFFLIQLDQNPGITFSSSSDGCWQFEATKWWESWAEKNNYASDSNIFIFFFKARIMSITCLQMFLQMYRLKRQRNFKISRLTTTKFAGFMRKPLGHGTKLRQKKFACSLSCHQESAVRRGSECLRRRRGEWKSWQKGRLNVRVIFFGRQLSEKSAGRRINFLRAKTPRWSKLEAISQK